MLNATDELIEFVAEQAMTLPARKHARILRALADRCGSDKEAKDLCQQAADLEAADRRCREFTFKLSLKT